MHVVDPGEIRSRANALLMGHMADGCFDAAIAMTLSSVGDTATLCIAQILYLRVRNHGQATTIRVGRSS